jgi:hypothetical protein
VTDLFHHTADEVLKARFAWRERILEACVMLNLHPAKITRFEGYPVPDEAHPETVLSESGEVLAQFWTKFSMEPPSIKYMANVRADIKEHLEQEKKACPTPHQ